MQAMTERNKRGQEIASQRTATAPVHRSTEEKHARVKVGEMSSCRPGDHPHIQNVLRPKKARRKSSTEVLARSHQTLREAEAEEASSGGDHLGQA